jgi:phosphopantothenoylcysteine decarboxylase / phosphopantothenate---cysteine ligase
MSGLSGKRILLIVGGGIAAYKTLDLIRRLREKNIAVRAVLTAAAQQFVTALSAASLSGDKAFTDLFSLTDEAEMGHIELSRDADLIVVAPATADLLAKMAHGLADDLASTLLLATDKKILAAPAMNLRMWLAKPTARNVAALRADGVIFEGPKNGEMACGEYGPGRMSEPLEILAAIETALASDTTLPLPEDFRAPCAASGALAGRRVVVTSGPTHEPIDPVRYIANRSSGKQGHAIAAAAREAGAEVTLVTGPVALADPAGVETIHVETARQMQHAVEAALPADIFIAAAAVADWRVAEAAPEKLKKSAGKAPRSLMLVENPDILAAIAQRHCGRPALVVGFAAETANLIENAKAKRLSKGCDVIVGNHVGAGSRVFAGDRNEVTLLTADGEESWPNLGKAEVASRLIAALAKKLGEPGK